jgi:hypothetical protein
MRFSLTFFGFLAVVACGSSDPPPKDPATPTPATSGSSASWILKDDECKGDDCYAIGMRLSDEEKLDASRKAFKRGCDLDPSSPKACTAYALMLAKGEGGAKDELTAFTISEKSCGADDPGGCLVHGLIAHQVKKDDTRAIADFDKACRLGLKAACKAKSDLSPSAPQASVDPGDDKSMNFTADQMTIEGLEIAKLECKLPGGGAGLLGALVVGKTLSAKKAEMSKCTKKPADVKVSWTNAGQTATDVKVETADAALKACIEKALVGAPATVPGKCTALVHLKP